MAALAAAAAKDGRQEVRLTQAEHRRTQAEQRAMVSNLIDHVMVHPSLGNNNIPLLFICHCRGTGL